MSVRSSITYYDFDRTYKRAELAGESWDLSEAFRGGCLRSPRGFVDILSLHRLPGDIWVLKGRLHLDGAEFYGRIGSQVVGSWLARAGYEVPRDVVVDPVEEDPDPVLLRVARPPAPNGSTEETEPAGDHLAPPPAPVGSAETVRVFRKKRHKRGEPALKVQAALEALAANGEWNAPESRIIKLARVSKSTYYHLLNNHWKVQAVREAYQLQRLGRGPAHFDQL